METEQVLQTILTVLTTLPSLPVLYVLYTRSLVFPLYIGGFTLVSSFMYHLTESLRVDWMYLTTVQWHKLDNISGITFLCSLLIHLMDNTQSESWFFSNSTDIELKLQLLALCLVLLMQTKDPWKLHNTFAPLGFFLCLAVGKHAFIQRARLHTDLLYRGIVCMAVALVCFLKGLKKDYLRTWHGLWHCFGTYATFYLWQSVSEQKPMSYATATTALVQGLVGILDY